MNKKYTTYVISVYISSLGLHIFWINSALRLSVSYSKARKGIIKRICDYAILTSHTHIHTYIYIYIYNTVSGEKYIDLFKIFNVPSVLTYDLDFEPQGETSPQVLTLLKGARFIAWCLRCPFFQGVPMAPDAILEPPGVSRLQPCAWTHLKIAFCPTRLFGGTRDKKRCG